MKTICILSGKGGVGKSASIKNIAHIMNSIYNKRVLLCDMDPQGNTSSMYGSIDFVELFINVAKGIRTGTEKSVEDLLLDTEMDVQECIRATRFKNLDIIPAFLTLAEVENLLKADIRTPQQFKLKTQLKKVAAEYDYCLIDCGPAVSLLNINALVASDEVYFPTRCDADSFIGIAIAMNLVRTVQSYNPGLKIGGCFFTQFAGWKNVSQTAYELLNQLAQITENKVLPITIGVSKFLEEQTFEQKPLLEVDSKRESRATNNYISLTEYLLADNKESYLNDMVNDIKKK